AVDAAVHNHLAAIFPRQTSPGTPGTQQLRLAVELAVTGIMGVPEALGGHIAGRHPQVHGVLAGDWPATHRGLQYRLDPHTDRLVVLGQEEAVPRRKLLYPVPLQASLFLAVEVFAGDPAILVATLKSWYACVPEAGAVVVDEFRHFRV